MMDDSIPSSIILDDIHNNSLFGDVVDILPTPTGPPDRTVFNGIYNFVVEIDGSNTQKQKYLYSHRLNRIYVNMECNFSVNFKWDTNEPMYVRATTVFSEPAQAQKRVERCIQHSHDSYNTLHRLEPHVVKNVLRSARAAGGTGVYYCGDVASADSWYSVLVAFPAPASHAFQFVCKNSCSSGINRRPIDLIFTLEDCAGGVFGRHVVGARVCSCPRRDMLADERQAGAKRRAAPAPAPAPPPPAKRLLRERADEDAVVTLPEMKIYGLRTASAGIKVMLEMMEHLKAIKSSVQQPVDELNKTINDLKTIKDNIKSIKKENEQ
ncbi:cellular tumor antigen p53 [Vanessa cardui]|uniref:cellular tumor antigen p53 n=1 Tax=Vanessa cardui TaxID=171605 RepID=UPI001F1341A3|nr:cellular tumor antigen p53 [Vanessa cardui]XP_046964146.1 cellular tumor antigen p53 [Vanessa cardui]XP_046964147.1 cellular tumor antigen p53 [Vanessa cardui]